MKRLRLIKVIPYIALFAVFQVDLAFSVEAMSESDMGEVSAESGDVLNIMGAPASGQVVSEQANTSDEQLDASSKQAQTSVNYLETDQSFEQRANTSLTPSDINPKDSISTFKISERTDGQLGAATIHYDAKNNLNSASVSGNTLTINQNVQVQQVQINQARHAIDVAPRGDYSFNGIQVNGSVSISDR